MAADHRQGGKSRSWAPAAAGSLFPSLRALQSDIEINEWDQPLPAFARVAIQYRLYRIDLQTDYRAYWDSNQAFVRTLKQAEGRTRKFAVEVDTAGIAAWTIRTWSERWGEQKAASDLLLAAECHADDKRLHAFALIDRGAQCAGLLAFVDADDLIFTTTARSSTHDSYGVGTRVLEFAIDWARAQGFKTFTLGSGRVTSYKRLWGPPVGDSWNFRVRPAAMDVVKRGKSALLAARGHATTVARSLAPAKSA